MRTPTQSPTLGRKSSPFSESGAQQAARRTAPPQESSESSSEDEPPTDEAPHNEARQRAWQMDTRFDAWHCKKIAKDTVG